MSKEFGYTGSEYSDATELQQAQDHLNHFAPEINESPEEYWQSTAEYTDELHSVKTLTTDREKERKQLHKKLVKKMVYTVASAVTVVSLAQAASLPETQSTIATFEEALEEIISPTVTSAPQEPLLATQTIVFSGSGILTAEAVEEEFSKYDLSNPFAVVIEDGYTEIGEKAFQETLNMVAVTIPDSVNTFGAYAFKGCSNLIIDVLNTAGRTIGSFAFENVTIKEVIISDTFNCYQSYHYPSLASANIQSISFEQGITSIPPYALCRCSTITSVDIPDTVNTIGSNAFSDCDALTDITLPDNVTTIEANAFEGCSGLIIDVLNTTGRTIGSFAFEDVTIKEVIISDTFSCYQSYHYPSLTDANIQNISFEQGITSIPPFALCRCSTITSVDIPDTVTTIGSNAFRECDALTDITLPDSITTIEANAFDGCSNLIFDVFNTAGRTIGSFAFKNVTIKEVIISDTFNCYQNHQYPSLTYADIQKVSFEQGITYIPAYALCRCFTITSVDIPDTVTAIGTDAFRECDALTHITIPGSVTTIESGTFKDCTNLTLYVSSGSAAEAYAQTEEIPYVIK